MLSELLPTVPLPLALASLLAAWAVASWFILPLASSRLRYLSSQAWVGLEGRFFSKLRAELHGIWHTRAMTVEGYREYTSRDKPFVLPRFRAAPMVVLPPSRLQEVLAVRESQLDPHASNAELIAQDYTLGKGFTEGPHINVVKRQLTRKLPTMTSVVYDEITRALHDEWPANEQDWIAVPAFESVSKLVSRVANRAFTGPVLCRDLEYIEHLQKVAHAVFTAGALFKLFPKFLHPVVAPILCRDIGRSRALCKQVMRPEIEDRLKHLNSAERSPDYKEPDDILQWLLQDSIEKAKEPGAESSEDRIMNQILALNFAAIHTTSAVTTHMLFDLYGSRHKEAFLEGLREECSRVLQKYHGSWTKDAVNELHRVDSALRESMRLHALSDVGLRRVVVDRNGVTLKDGTHFPYGLHLGFPTYAMHTDPATFPEEPEEFDAFRFSRQVEKEAAEAIAGNDAARLQDVLERKQQALVVTGESFMSFGGGRHPCPGRFFASQEMKLLIAYIVMNYDVKLEGGKRPPNMLIFGSCSPNESAELQLRRR